MFLMVGRLWYKLYFTLLGLRNGGGISETMRIMSYESKNLGRYYVRLVYDLSFFSLITIIFLNIIFGIIIDTFGGLRE